MLPELSYLNMIERFIDYLRYELNRASLTVEAYSRDIRQFSSWLGKDDPDDIDFKSVTSSDVRGWLASMARSGESSRTIRRKSQSLRALFRWMRKTGLITVSPMRDIPLPKISKPLPDLVKPEEIETAINEKKSLDNDISVDNVMESLILEMLYSTGIRRAELIAVNDSDISFTNGEIKVTGKRSKQRVIPVAMDLLNKIREWQILRDKEEEMPGDDKPLFVFKGKRISPTKVYNIVHNALGSSSARKRSPHALRHSFASAMLNGGANIDSVREFLGHASLATTQIYTHISLNEIKKAYSTAHPRSQETKK